jgi:hypothetical protein
MGHLKLKMIEIQTTESSAYALNFNEIKLSYQKKKKRLKYKVQSSAYDVHLDEIEL